jgi:hypothetical protein
LQQPRLREGNVEEAKVSQLAAGMIWNIVPSPKLRVTSVLPHSSWTLSEAQVRAVVAAIEQDEVA